MNRSGNIYRFAVLAAVAGILVACQGPKQTEETAPQRPTETIADERGFDPLELPRDKEVVPQRYPRAGAIEGSGTLVAASDKTADSASGMIENLPVAVDSANNQAYRVQFFTSKVHGEARHEVEIAEEIFDQPVYLDYEVPYYKARVGNFADREDAERYQQKVRAIGYQSAWVVMVNTAVKESAPMYEEPADVMVEDTLLPATEPGTDE